ncbi:MAG: B12-binding domain-containing radical SAM protein [Spirochaetia bacterium]|nr:B12-binding domain-containing radical SAM protein [Spirochaetia bacterium]
MKELYKSNAKCLIVQSKFSAFSFWNYIEVCKLVDAKYPAAPLGLMTVAALLPQHWEFKLIDENVEELLDEHFKWADIVCTGGMLPQQKGMLKIIERAHSAGLPVVIGGPDPTAQPEIYKDADYLVSREGELTIPMFLKDLQKGAKKGVYIDDTMADMTKSPIPRYDLINFKNYIHVGIQYSRGCPFICEFCDIIELYGRKPRTKTTEQVLAELDVLYKLGYRGHVDFVDDNFIGNKNNVKKALPEIYKWSKEHGFPFFFTTEASINLADDDALLDMMKQCDFRFVFIGIETPDDDLLVEMGKRQNVNKPIKESILKIYQHGMVVNGGFIMGFDNEKSDIADRMIEFVQDTGITLTMLGTLYALPNTQLTRRLRKEGRLFEEGSSLEEDTSIDQLTSGLNFLTKRPRLEILKDYARVIEYIYNPKRYFERVIYTSLNIKVDYKFKPTFKEKIFYLKSFLRVTAKLGFNSITGIHYWKMIFLTLFKNIKGIEAAVNLAAMYIHFYTQSKFIVKLTRDKINEVENHGEDKYNDRMKKTTAVKKTEKNKSKTTMIKAKPQTKGKKGKKKEFGLTA